MVLQKKKQSKLHVGMSKNSPLKCLSCSEAKINFRPTLLYTFMETHVGLSNGLVLPYAYIPQNFRSG